jgi:hypothetical protein
MASEKAKKAKRQRDRERQKTRNQKHNKTTEKNGILTPLQSRFAAALMTSRTKAEAALKAGYSPENPAQSGNQAFNAILLKAPEAMGECGLNMKAVIQNHLVPLLHSKITKLAQHEGEFTDYVELENDAIRMKATITAFMLLGAFKGANEAQEKKTVEYIVVDMPQQKWPDEELETVEVAAKSGPANPAPKKDPRPKDRGGYSANRTYEPGRSAERAAPGDH